MRNSLRQEVEHLLMSSQKYRDDDDTLALEILAQHGCILNTQQRLAFRSAPSIDVMIRRRRELSVKYPPSLMVAERRYKHYRWLTEEFSSGNWFKRLIDRRGL